MIELCFMCASLWWWCESVLWDEQWLTVSKRDWHSAAVGERRWTEWQSSSSLLLRSWQTTQLTLSKLKAHKVSPSVVNWHMIIYPFNNKSRVRGTADLKEIFRHCRYTIRPLVTIYSVSQSNKYRGAVFWRWCRYLRVNDTNPPSCRWY